MAASPLSTGTLSQGGAGSRRGSIAQSLGIEMAKLEVFSSRMAAHGFAIVVSRLFFDPRYAYKRLALAHTTDDDALKALAVELLEQYKQLEWRRRGVFTFSQPH